MRKILDATYVLVILHRCGQGKAVRDPRDHCHVNHGELFLVSDFGCHYFIDV